jgi:CHAT domain-containing protein
MSEISGLEMDADMVVLSACKTGVLEKNEVEEGLSGLSRVFFYAGTPRLAVTLWPIADEGTQALMEAWYKRLKSGTTSTLESLNAAKQDMLASKELSHPFFWAPFILLGESK